MACWVRFEYHGNEGFGTVAGDRVAEYAGDMLGECHVTGKEHALRDVRLLTPTRPSKMIGLWNNFHERARVENLQRPEHPLYFLKAANSFLADGGYIQRPEGYQGRVVFEGELGIVIGKRCAHVSVEQAPAVIFGYTCANDVTARDILRADPSFPQWTRAKSFDTFGVFGPCIATGIDAMALRVRTIVAGVERQNYAVADMFFPPHDIVASISRDMTLEAGDIIICGTSVGAGEMQDGDSVAVSIDGIGVLSNRFG